MRVFFVFFCAVIDVAWTGRFIIGFGDFPCESPMEDECVPIKNCPFFVELLEHYPIPRPRSVIGVIRKHHCGLFNNEPKVCCSRQTTTTSTTTTTSSTTPVPAPASVHQEVHKREPDWFEDDLTTHRYFDMLPNDICGLSQSAPDFRITSGSATVVGEFPWMALIAYATENPDDSLDFRCGGTVIHERYVLTAAHCILNTSIIGVRLGEHDLTTSIDCSDDYCAPPPQDFFVEDLIVHPKYDPKTFANDIALLKLATPANFTTPSVRPICLPTSSAVEVSGKNAVVCGWGVTEYGHKSAVLLKASLPLVPLQRCRRVYRRFAPVGGDQVCAGGVGGRDSCGGDSGGPLHVVGRVRGAVRVVQHGVVSFGPRVCGSEGQPGVYTAVAPYAAWMLDSMGKGG